MILSRGVGGALLAEIVKPAFHPVMLVRLGWPGGVLRWHTNRGNISWSSNTWTGVGDFGQVDIPEEAAGLVATEAMIRIVGTFDDVLDASETVIKNRSAIIYWGAVTKRAGNVLVGTPVEIFAGVMDGTLVQVGEDGGKQVYGLELTLGSGPGARTGASITHSQEDQAARYPSDTAGRHVQYAWPNAKKMTWPA